MRHERTNLESELRANRPVPSHELVNRLEGRVREAAAPAPVRSQQASWPRSPRSAGSDAWLRRRATR